MADLHDSLVPIPTPADEESDLSAVVPTVPQESTESPPAPPAPPETPLIPPASQIDSVSFQDEALRPIPFTPTPPPPVKPLSPELTQTSNVSGIAAVRSIEAPKIAQPAPTKLAPLEPLLFQPTQAPPGMSYRPLPTEKPRQAPIGSSKMAPVISEPDFYDKVAEENKKKSPADRHKVAQSIATNARVAYEDLQNELKEGRMTPDQYAAKQSEVAQSANKAMMKLGELGLVEHVTEGAKEFGSGVVGFGGDVLGIIAGVASVGTAALTHWFGVTTPDELAKTFLKSFKEGAVHKLKGLALWNYYNTYLGYWVGTHLGGENDFAKWRRDLETILKPALLTKDFRTLSPDQLLKHLESLNSILGVTYNRGSDVDKVYTMTPGLDKAKALPLLLDFIATGSEEAWQALVAYMTANILPGEAHHQEIVEEILKSRGAEILRHTVGDWAAERFVGGGDLLSFILIERALTFGFGGGLRLGKNLFTKAEMSSVYNRTIATVTAGRTAGLSREAIEKELEGILGEVGSKTSRLTKKVAKTTAHSLLLGALLTIEHNPNATLKDIGEASVHMFLLGEVYKQFAKVAGKLDQRESTQAKRAAQEVQKAGQKQVEGYVDTTGSRAEAAKAAFEDITGEKPAPAEDVAEGEDVRESIFGKGKTKAAKPAEAPTAEENVPIIDAATARAKELRQQAKDAHAANDPSLGQQLDNQAHVIESLISSRDTTTLRDKFDFGKPPERKGRPEGEIRKDMERNRQAGLPTEHLEAEEGVASGKMTEAQGREHIQKKIDELEKKIDDLVRKKGESLRMGGPKLTKSEEQVLETSQKHKDLLENAKEGKPAEVSKPQPAKPDTIANQLRKQIAKLVTDRAAAIKVGNQKLADSIGEKIKYLQGRLDARPASAPAKSTTPASKTPAKPSAPSPAKPAAKGTDLVAFLTDHLKRLMPRRYAAKKVFIVKSTDDIPSDAKAMPISAAEEAGEGGTVNAWFDPNTGEAFFLAPSVEAKAKKNLAKRGNAKPSGQQARTEMAHVLKGLTRHEVGVHAWLEFLARAKGSDAYHKLGNSLWERIGALSKKRHGVQSAEHASIIQQYTGTKAIDVTKVNDKGPEGDKTRSQLAFEWLAREAESARKSGVVSDILRRVIMWLRGQFKKFTPDLETSDLSDMNIAMILDDAMKRAEAEPNKFEKVLKSKEQSEKPEPAEATTKPQPTKADTPIEKQAKAEMNPLEKERFDAYKKLRASGKTHEEAIKDDAYLDTFLEPDDGETGASLSFEPGEDSALTGLKILRSKEPKILMRGLHLGPKHRPTVLEIASWFRDHFLGDRTEYDKASEQQNAALEKLLFNEAVAVYGNDPTSIGWYKRNVGLMFDVLTELDPSLKTKSNQAVFKMLLAVTSNGNAVRPQLEMALDTYHEWLATGKFTKKFLAGTQVGRIREDVDAIAAMMKHFEGDPLKLQRFLMKSGPRSEVIKAFGPEGEGVFSEEEARKVGAGELFETTVPYSVVFGPKLGSFFWNLNGNFSTVTMDLWFMRQLGRLTNTLLDDIDEFTLQTKKERLLYAMSQLHPDELEYFKVPLHEDTEGIIGSAHKISTAAGAMDPFLREKAKTEAPEFNEFRKAAVDLSNYVKNTNVSPRNGSERQWIRERMNNVRDMLASRGIDMDPADLQALLWYAEKQIYSKLNYREKKTDNDYAAAADAIFTARTGEPSKEYKDATHDEGKIGSLNRQLSVEKFDDTDPSHIMGRVPAMAHAAHLGADWRKFLAAADAVESARTPAGIKKANDELVAMWAKLPEAAKKAVHEAYDTTNEMLAREAEAKDAGIDFDTRQLYVHSKLRIGQFLDWLDLAKKERRFYDDDGPELNAQEKKRLDDLTEKGWENKWVDLIFRSDFGRTRLSLAYAKNQPLEKYAITHTKDNPPPAPNIFTADGEIGGALEALQDRRARGEKLDAPTALGDAGQHAGIPFIEDRELILHGDHWANGIEHDVFWDSRVPMVGKVQPRVVKLLKEHSPFGPAGTAIDWLTYISGMDAVNRILGDDKRIEAILIDKKSGSPIRPIISQPFLMRAKGAGEASWRDIKMDLHKRGWKPRSNKGRESDWQFTKSPDGRLLLNDAHPGNFVRVRAENGEIVPLPIDVIIKSNVEGKTASELIDEAGGDLTKFGFKDPDMVRYNVNGYNVTDGNGKRANSYELHSREEAEFFIKDNKVEGATIEPRQLKPETPQFSIEAKAEIADILREFAEASKDNWEKSMLAFLPRLREKELATMDAAELLNRVHDGEPPEKVAEILDQIQAFSELPSKRMEHQLSVERDDISKEVLEIDRKIDKLFYSPARKQNESEISRLQGQRDTILRRQELLTKREDRQRGGTAGREAAFRPNQRRVPEGHVGFVHWSDRAGLSQLDPGYHGTGIPGAERQRRDASSDNYVNRTYVGLPGYRREGGLGEARYVGSVDRSLLYDFVGDPLDIISLAEQKFDRTLNRAGFINEYERLIREHGFIGYRAGEVAALFHPVPTNGPVGGEQFAQSAPEYARRSPQEVRASYDRKPARLSVEREEEISRGPLTDAVWNDAIDRAKQGRIMEAFFNKNPTEEKDFDTWLDKAYDNETLESPVKLWDEFLKWGRSRKEPIDIEDATTPRLTEGRQLSLEPVKDPEDMTIRRNYGAWIDPYGRVYKVDNGHGPAALDLYKDYHGDKADSETEAMDGLMADGWVRVVNAGRYIYAHSRKGPLGSGQMKSLRIIGENDDREVRRDDGKTGAFASKTLFERIEPPQLSIIRKPHWTDDDLERGAHLYQRGLHGKAAWVASMRPVTSDAEAMFPFVAANWRDILARPSPAGELVGAAKEAVSNTSREIRANAKRVDIAAAQAGIASMAGSRGRKAANYIRRAFGIKMGDKPSPEQQMKLDATGFVVEAFRETYVQQLSEHIAREFGLPLDQATKLADGIGSVKTIFDATDTDLMEALDDDAHVAALRQTIKTMKDSGTVPPDFTKPVTPAEAEAALDEQIRAIGRSAASVALKRKWIPILKYAQSHFSELTPLATKVGDMMDWAHQFETENNIPTTKLEHYLTHVYSNLNELTGTNLPNSMTTAAGGSKYFLKGRTIRTMANAIAKGLDPKGSDVGDLVEHRVRTGSRLVEMQRLAEEMYQAQFDGKPIFKPVLRTNYWRLTDPATKKTAGNIYRSADKWIVDVDGSPREVLDSEPDARARAAALGLTDKFIRSGSDDGHANYTEMNIMGQSVHVYNPLVRAFETIFNEKSFFRGSWKRELPVRFSTGVKHVAVIGDIFHMFNIIKKAISSTGKLNANPWSENSIWNKHLPILEYDAATMAEMRRRGEITAEQKKFYDDNREDVELGQKHGLNTGLISDALFSDTMGIFGDFLTKHVPGGLGAPLGWMAGKYDTWLSFLFKKLTRGSMVATYLNFFKANLKKGMSRDDAARGAADQSNDFYGSPGSTAWLKSRTGQDFLRATMFAPLWEMGQFNTLARTAVDVAKLPWDLVHGRVGNFAKTAMMAFVVGAIAAQAINFATTGHSTFENEEGHKLDAFIPGGENGFYFNPLTFVSHELEQFIHYMHQGENAWNAAVRIGRNKLSAPARAGITAVTGTDYRGRQIGSVPEQLAEAANQVVPMPIPIAALMDRGVGELVPKGLSSELIPKQAMATIGFTAQTAETLRMQMALKAKKFAPASGGNYEVSKYSNLRRAMHFGRDEQVKQRIIGLLEGGATVKSLMGAMGISVNKEEMKLKNTYFTGSKENEGDFYSSLSEHEKEQYQQAIQQGAEDAKKFLQIYNQIPHEDIARAEAIGQIAAHPMRAHPITP